MEAAPGDGDVYPAAVRIAMTWPLLGLERDGVASVSCGAGSLGYRLGKHVRFWL